MREAVRNLDRLLHIQECMDNIQEFIGNKTFDEFVADKLLFYAVVKNVEIIGEAANMLTHEFRDEHTEVDWRPIVAMRNVLVHDYIHISQDMLWATITQDIHHFKIHIEKFYEEFK